MKEWLGKIVDSPWFLPGSLMAYGVGCVMTAILHHGLNTTMGCALAGVMMASQFTIGTITKSRARERAYDRERFNDVMTQKDHAWGEYEKVAAIVTDVRRQHDILWEKYSDLQENYDELLAVRTDEVIAAIHERLVDDKPTEFALPDVPQAPQAPPDVQAPF